MSEIADWYAGKKILVTGVTGFIGKVLVEKLLSSCPNIATIYLFVRPKKGKTAEERKNQIFENILFDALKSSNPEQLNKVKMINGALSKTGLNLNETDEYELIENCNLIFHIAASVQFDRSLHEIAETNVIGLKHMLELAKNMKNLHGFIFCSTAFAQYADIPMEEKAYEPPMKAVTLNRILEKFDENLISALSKRMLGRHANTYVFTKSIAEDLVSEYVNDFPIAIARPSIVVNAAYGPLRGWTEGVNGFNGCGIVAGFGLIKVVLANNEVPRYIIPVDIASNALIVTGWQTAIKKPNEVKYYNFAEDISIAQKYTYKQIEYKINSAAKKYPFEYALMPYGYTVTQNQLYFKLLELWYHIFTGSLADLLLIILGKGPMVLKVHRKIIYHMQTVKYYINNRFIFISKEFSKFKYLLNDRDKILFPVDVEEALSGDFYELGFLGCRKFLLKQSDETLPWSRKLQIFLSWLGNIIYATIAYWIITFFYRKFTNIY